MKKYQKFMVALTALLILTNCIPAFAAETGLDEPDMSITDEVQIADETLIEDEAPIMNDAPMFSAYIQYSFEGYVVKGTFTEFSDDINNILTLYSLDGENYQECGVEWNLYTLGTNDPEELTKLQTQICLYDNLEPLKSYLAGALDRFYLKLRIIKKNGSTYESKTAVIERGEVQALPEGTYFNASFASSVGVLEKNPFNYYGRYQLTVNPTATPEEISALLPDTLPIQVDIYQGRNLVAECIVDCPVTWKSLSLPQLTAGESVTIPDATEKIVVPEGTLLNTPIGIFRLDEALPLTLNMLSDEVRLILNVIPENESPTGVLSQENDGLEVALNFKPTGATDIHAYIFSEQESEWVKLSDIPLLDAVNAQPSNANSGYTLLIRNDQEPYQSYLAAEAEGSVPTPFFVGLKIEGGVYNGQQLTLAWPGTYELPPNLPKIGGVGGNENNAGSDNKEDSTTEGQRPNLPNKQEKEKETKKAGSEQTTDSTQGGAGQTTDSKQNDSVQMTDAKKDSSAQTTASKQDGSAQTTVPKQDGSTQTTVPNQDASTQTAASLQTGSTQAQDEQPDQENERASDSDKDSTQSSAATQAAAIDKPSDIALLTTLPPKRNRILILLAAVSITGICIAAVTAKVTMKKKY